MAITFNVQTAILLVVPAFVSFNYVYADKLYNTDPNSNLRIITEQFYFVIISSALIQLMWFFNIFNLCSKSSGEIKSSRAVSLCVLLQTVLAYGLSPYMSLALSELVYTRSIIGDLSDTINQLYTWSSVCTAFMWFVFLSHFLVIAVRLIPAAGSKSAVQEELTTKSIMN